jgi:hypothetical protein
MFPQERNFTGGCTCGGRGVGRAFSPPTPPVYTRIAAVGRAPDALQKLEFNMGRKSKAKSEADGIIQKKTEEGVKKVRENKAEDRSFVCCMSCYLCDTASFERAELGAYRSHLAVAHGVTRNLEALLNLTPHLQAGEANYPYYTLSQTIFNFRTYGQSVWARNFFSMFANHISANS